MPTPVSLSMYVQPGTLPPVPPRCRLSEDPHRPTPLLTLVTVVDNAPQDVGTYSTTACQAILQLTAADWANMCAVLADGGHQTRVDIVYDSSAAGTNKPLISPPAFVPVPPLPPGPLGQVANAIHAAEARVESGVSAELREDIRHTRNAIDAIQATLNSIKAKVDTL